MGDGWVELSWVKKNGPMSISAARLHQHECTACIVNTARRRAGFCLISAENKHNDPWESVHRGKRGQLTPWKNG